MTSYQTNFRKDTRTQFEQIVLVLQGGGALGSYQAGVYQALAEANLQPNWVAGISIGAINSAIIAGNAPDKRVGSLAAGPPRGRATIFVFCKQRAPPLRRAAQKENPST
jgi:NTE family protein